MSKIPLISIVIVTYKSRSFIDFCLKPFVARSDFEIILFENASDDGIADYVRESYPFVQVVESKKNLGFACGNNQAFRHCQGKYILLLNPDAFVEDAAVVDRLARILDEDATIGAVGPRLNNIDGSHQVGDAGWRIRFGTILTHAFLLQRAFAGLPSLYLTNKRLLNRERVDVDWVCGACMMIRSSVLAAVGGLDEDVFMYGEDIEWGTRIRNAGWRVTYHPRISVLHLQGATQKGEAQHFYSPKWLDDAAKRYALIGNWAGYVTLKICIFTGYGLRALVWISAGIILCRPVWRTKGHFMWRYARHGLSLPSYARQRGAA